MKPNLTFFFALLLCTFSSVAQQPNSIAEQLRNKGLSVPGAPKDMLLQCALGRAIHKAAKSTSASGSRLVASVRYDCDGVSYNESDSTSYIYLGARGGDLETGVKSDFTYTYWPGFTNKTTNTFDPHDNITTSLWQYQYPASTWQNISRYTWTYDALDSVTSVVYETWDSAVATWFGTEKNVYTYAGGKIADITYQHWDGTSSAWADWLRMIYAYDGSGNLASYVSQARDTSGVWADIYKVSYTYSAASLVLTDTRQYMDGSGTWINSFLTTYAYDASNNKVSEESSNWNTTTGAWNEEVRFLYSSFVGGKPQVVINQYFNPSTSAYENEVKHSYTYNSYLQKTFDKIEAWDGSGWILPNGASAAMKYYYEEFATGIADQQSNQVGITIYPNPVSRDLNITGVDGVVNDVFLLNTLGQRIQSAKPGNGLLRMDVTALAPGMYYVVLDGEKGRKVVKFVKE